MPYAESAKVELVNTGSISGRHNVRNVLADDAS
jgi:hypothetical protein